MTLTEGLLGAILGSGVTLAVSVIGMVAMRWKRRDEVVDKREADKKELTVTHLHAKSEYTDDLREDIRSLKSEVASLQAKWLAAEKDNIALHGKIAEQSVQIEKLKDGKRAVTMDCEEQITILQRENIDLRAQVLGLKTELTALRRELEASRQTQDVHITNPASDPVHTLNAGKE